MDDATGNFLHFSDSARKRKRQILRKEQDIQACSPEKKSVVQLLETQFLVTNICVQWIRHLPTHRLLRGSDGLSAIRA